MPPKVETTPPPRIWKPLALLALSVMLSAGLAGCGGGSDGGGQVMIVPDPSGPDLVVESPALSGAVPAAGEGFTLSVRVRNAGSRAAPAATLRFYRSADATITPSDEEETTKALEGPAASESVVASVTLTAPLTPGTYYYGACVDAVEGESDAANNCSASVRFSVQGLRAPALGAQFLGPASSRPNLVALKPSLSPTSPVAGTLFDILATVRNDGGGRVERSWMRFYRSTDATITRSDAQIGRAYEIPGVEPSDLWGQSTDIRAPSAHGTYYYGACADAAPGESDVANNCSPSVRVTVRPPPQPNLLVESPSVSNGSPAMGGFFWLRATFRILTGRMPGFWMRVYRSDTAAFTTSSLQFKEYWYADLDEDSTSSRRRKVFLRAPTGAGDYYYRACAITTSNCSAAVKIEVSHNKPNLVIVGRSWPNAVHPGDRFYLTARVQNNGGPSEETRLRFLLLPDRTSPPSSGTEAGSVAVPRLVTPEGAKPKSFGGLAYLTAPSPTGTYYYVACVDAVADESQTTDNCSKVYKINVV